MLFAFTYYSQHSCCFKSLEDSLSLSSLFTLSSLSLSLSDSRVIHTRASKVGRVSVRRKLELLVVHRVGVLRLQMLSGFFELFLCRFFVSGCVREFVSE